MNASTFFGYGIGLSHACCMRVTRMILCKSSNSEETQRIPYRYNKPYDTLLASDLSPIERTPRLSTPVSIVVGEQSPESMLEVGKQLSRAIPNAKKTILEGQDHMPDPEWLLPLLSSFLYK